MHSTETPAEWKNLPSLAIPDGAHNYVKGTCSKNQNILPTLNMGHLITLLCINTHTQGSVMELYFQNTQQTV